MPINLSQLSSYGPTKEPPNMEEYEVYDKISKLKNDKSTLHIGLPNNFRKELSADLLFCFVLFCLI